MTGDMHSLHRRSVPQQTKARLESRSLNSDEHVTQGRNFNRLGSCYSVAALHLGRGYGENETGTYRLCQAGLVTI